MRTTTFRLPGIPPGQNTSTRGAGWQRNAALKKEWGDKMRWEIRAARIQGQWDGRTFLRARITTRFHYPTRQRHDPDNAAGAVKLFLDAFTQECVIVDDDFAHIELLITAGPVHRPGYVDIIVEELEAAP
ncbi:MAG: hypothetical protein M0Z85_00155 [Gammaproteobacteria bacterium]|nr:hypothetical protein [Gammaproteobacteria bacterium]